MRTHGHTTISHPTSEWSPAQPMDRGLCPGRDPAGRAVHDRRRCGRAVAADRGRPGRAAGPARLGGRRGRHRRQPGAGPVRPPEDGAGDQLPPRRPAGGHPGQPGRRRRPRLSPQLRASREDPTPPPQPPGGDRPSTGRGRPTGPAIQTTARRLQGAEARRAARLLAAKHPLLHGVLVPLTHRLGRAKTGKTVHFPADIPRPWPGEVTTHGHPEPLKTHSREARVHTGKPLGVLASMAAIQ